MIILDTLLVGGLRFVLGRIAAAVDSELNDEAALRESLLAAHMRLELGEISEAEFAELERTLLARINAVRGDEAGPIPASGEWKVTGVEATIAGDESPDADAQAARARRRR
jgi:hypothetical protein